MIFTIIIGIASVFGIYKYLKYRISSHLDTEIEINIDQIFDEFELCDE